MVNDTGYCVSGNFVNGQCAQISAIISPAHMPSSVITLASPFDGFRKRQGPPTVGAWLQLRDAATGAVKRQRTFTPKEVPYGMELRLVQHKSALYMLSGPNVTVLDTATFKTTTQYQLVTAPEESYSGTSALIDGRGNLLFHSFDENVGATTFYYCDAQTGKLIWRSAKIFHSVTAYMLNSAQQIIAVADKIYLLLIK